MADLTYAEISKLLKYEPETGKLFWLARTPDAFSDGKRPAEYHCVRWNTRHAGKEAFTAINTSGYHHSNIKGRVMIAHRLIWLLHYGVHPNGQIDHINGVRNDNRIVNLRDVTKTENMRNQRLHSDNSSGAHGVLWIKRKAKWQAQMRSGGRCRHLGYFDDLQDAISARKAAEALQGYHPNHGR